MEEKQVEGRNIPPIITLTAALITCVFCIRAHAKLLFTLKTVLLVMLVFFILGVIVQKIVVKINADAEEAAAQRQREELERAAEELTEMEQGEDEAVSGEAVQAAEGPENTEDA